MDPRGSWTLLQFYHDFWYMTTYACNDQVLCAFFVHRRDSVGKLRSSLRPALARSALPVLERVVLETLRLRPPAYIVGRCAAAPVTLAGFDLQQGAHAPLAAATAAVVATRRQMRSKQRVLCSRLNGSHCQATERVA